MASANTDAVIGAAASAPVTATATSQTTEGNRPLEMSTLNVPTEPETPATPSVGTALASATAAPDTTEPSTFQHPPQPSEATPQDALKRTETEPLGPASEAPIAHPTTSNAIGPVLNISLMLTTGARHPYKIDEKYLRNRKVAVKNSDGDFEPRELSGYQLKELIWTDWRSEWEPRPASPSSIRLIVMGRMIEDKQTLKDFPFNLTQTNVVHMTVKPADFDDDDQTGAGKGTGKGGVPRARDGEDRGAGCRCVIL